MVSHGKVRCAGIFLLSFFLFFIFLEVRWNVIFTSMFSGTSLYLKSKFGVGYLLTMVKNANYKPQQLENVIKGYPYNIFIFSFCPFCSFILFDIGPRHIPDASLLSDFGAELSYRLPGKEISLFSELFTEIDKSQDELGIDSYGISLTTLEEVFLQIGLEEKSVSLL